MMTSLFALVELILIQGALVGNMSTLFPTNKEFWKHSFALIEVMENFAEEDEVYLVLRTRFRVREILYGEVRVGEVIEIERSISIGDIHPGFTNVSRVNELEWPDREVGRCWLVGLDYSTGKAEIPANYFRVGDKNWPQSTDCVESDTLAFQKLKPQNTSRR